MSGKNRITKLKLNEISAVDRPAQPGATRRLMKRAETSNDDGNQETSMFKTRDELLVAISKALTGSPTAAERENIAKSAVELKSLADVPASLLKGTTVKPEKPEADGVPEPDADDVKGRLKKAEAIVALPANQKAHYDTLKSDTDRDAYLAKSSKERDTDISKSQGDDPVVYTTMDGVDIRKSSGDLVVSLAKRNDTLAKDLAVEKAARLDADLTKRAETDLSKLAGDLTTRKALLKAIDGITDPAVRTEVMKSLSAANTAMSGAFKRTGSGGSPEDGQLEKSAGSPDEAEAKLDELAKTLQKADPKMDYATAYTKTLESPEGRVLYKAMQPQ